MITDIYIGERSCAIRYIYLYVSLHGTCQKASSRKPNIHLSNIIRVSISLYVVANTALFRIVHAGVVAEVNSTMEHMYRAAISPNLDGGKSRLSHRAAIPCAENSK